MARRGGGGSSALVIGLGVAVLAGSSCSGDDAGSTRASDQTTSPTAGCDTQLSVFFDVGIDDEDLAAAGSTLESTNGVVDVEVFDQEAAAAEARRLFADDPSTLEVLEDRAIAPFIRIQVVDASARQRVADVADDLPLVADVKIASAPSPALADVVGNDGVRGWCD